MINWQTVVLNLQHDYKSLSTVAKEIGMDWRHLHRLARGEVDEPRFNSGLKLLDLHERHCKAKHRMDIIGSLSA